MPRFWRPAPGSEDEDWIYSLLYYIQLLQFANQKETCPAFLSSLLLAALCFRNDCKMHRCTKREKGIMEEGRHIWLVFTHIIFHSYICAYIYMPKTLKLIWDVSLAQWLHAHIFTCFSIQQISSKFLQYSELQEKLWNREGTGLAPLGAYNLAGERNTKQLGKQIITLSQWCSEGKVLGGVSTCWESRTWQQAQKRQSRAAPATVRAKTRVGVSKIKLGRWSGKKEVPALEICKQALDWEASLQRTE